MTAPARWFGDRVLRLVSLGALTLVVGCTVMLVGQYAIGQWRASAVAQRVAALDAAARQDPAKTPELLGELDRQTRISLDRQHRARHVAVALIAATGVFLATSKWRQARRGIRPYTPGANPHPALSRGKGEGLNGTLAAPLHGEVAPQDEMTKAGKMPAPQRTPALLSGGGRPARPAAAPQTGKMSGAELVPEVDLAAVEPIVHQHAGQPGSTIAILQALQEHYRYLPQAALQRVCEVSEITPAQIAGVASFYTRFRTSPVGRHMVRVCHGTACHVAGAERLTDQLRRLLGLSSDEHTSADGEFTLEQVACLGCCTLAPVVQMDGVTHGHTGAEELAGLLHECRCAAKTGSGQGEPSNLEHAAGNGTLGEIRIGLGSCCVAGGSAKVYDALQQAVSETLVRPTVKRVGCVGMCHNTPLGEAVLPDGRSQLYTRVRPGDVRRIVHRHFPPQRLTKRLVGRISQWIEEPESDSHHAAGREPRDPLLSAFLGPQRHIATEHGGRIDPTDLDEYIAHGGFAALRRCLALAYPGNAVQPENDECPLFEVLTEAGQSPGLEAAIQDNECPRFAVTPQKGDIHVFGAGGLSPEQVIEQITASGLRGRGGAGFPSGRKWAMAAAASGDEKYAVCNGDEGDPGAFMDRMLMESFPYRIIEGLAIAAYAIGAQRGLFYIRAEYPLALERIRGAIDECRRRGLIGEHAFGPGRAFEVEIVQGAGAFVCGEETALLASIEGRRGTPSLRPPYPVECGLWGRPTLVNNVETLALVPWIIREGPAAFAALGTPTSRGTKVFALAGKVARGGLIEVPMGVTIRQIVEQIGGGVRDGRTFKAVQIGGPSGGCVPAALADTPVDFEALAGVGAIMGSGGLVVLDDRDCMVDMARYFLAFTQDQSCGKCTYCRVGTKRMLEILDRLCTGKGEARDLAELEHLAAAVRDASLCGLGRTAPNPVLTTLRYFRDEYEAHLAGRCPAGRCTKLIHYRVTEQCTGCTVCAQHCPTEAIGYTPYVRHVIDDAKCTRCDICRARCPEQAICVE